MPVSTRSQITSFGDESNQERAQTSLRGRAVLRNPHHGLKEKMKALTLFYEQHKELMASRRDLADSIRKVQRQEEVEEEEKDSTVMKENVAFQSPSKNAKRSIAFTRIDAKENREIDLTGPKKVTVARKLSTGALSEGRTMRTTGEAPENCESGGSRILVFVRLRPMAKKEKEAGSRSCIKIVNRKDVYLTEFASETDYLRLKRLRGRHFCFDAAFSDSTTQQEVYVTT